MQEGHAGEQAAKYRPRGFLAQAPAGGYNAEEFAPVVERQHDVDVLGVLEHLRVAWRGAIDVAMGGGTEVSNLGLFSLCFTW